VSFRGAGQRPANPESISADPVFMDSGLAAAAAIRNDGVRPWHTAHNALDTPAVVPDLVRFIG
jgi:hypothetical protein